SRRVDLHAIPGESLEVSSRHLRPTGIVDAYEQNSGLVGHGDPLWGGWRAWPPTLMYQRPDGQQQSPGARWAHSGGQVTGPQHSCMADPPSIDRRRYG